MAQASAPAGVQITAPTQPAYVLDGRVLSGRVAATVFAILAIVGIAGLGIAAQDKSVFDLARLRQHHGAFLSTEVARPGVGFLIGPLLILAALPRLRGRTPRIAFMRAYRLRVVIAILLWTGGLLALIVTVSDWSDQGYTIKPGTYIAAAILSIGLVATAAMLPFGLRVVEADAAGNVAGPPEGHAPSPGATPNLPPNPATR